MFERGARLTHPPNANNMQYYPRIRRYLQADLKAERRARFVNIKLGAVPSEFPKLVFSGNPRNLLIRLEQLMNRICRKMVAACGLFLFLAVGTSLKAQPAFEPSADLSYSLFNPVPADKLRELSTDRPGKSHSAITVDAGHFQIESDFLNYTYDPHGSGGITTRAYSVGTPIVKLGVTNWMDVELGLAMFNSLHQSDGSSANTSNGGAGGPITARGFGDTFLGAKINAFGNDGGDQSFAFLPFLKLPTAASGIGNDHVEFTVNVPYTLALSKPWSLTLEPNVGYLRNSDNTAYRGDYGFIVNLNRPIFVKGLTAAVELAVDASTEGMAETKMSFDPSLQYLVSKNLQFDVRAYLGLNKASPRYNPYIGVSYRF